MQCFGLELWESLESMEEVIDKPRMCGGGGGRGEFNVILKLEEKLGALPVTHREIVDFT